ncbi:hypothetical protein [Glaciecola petra]|uniref:Uncharacterized protein n=1 Tax=Glaciecola petra TaxID=3075602 RepID=A0ABU2ZQG2_9ALTE|nr:hypothetical protein [Aestuariibacter sp. P117]MDT0594579.1 hypothetical protein [Aestuariibacter sp. P117]
MSTPLKFDEPLQTQLTEFLSHANKEKNVPFFRKLAFWSFLIGLAGVIFGAVNIQDKASQKLIYENQIAGQKNTISNLRSIEANLNENLTQIENERQSIINKMQGLGEWIEDSNNISTSGILDLISIRVFTIKREGMTGKNTRYRTYIYLDYPDLVADDIKEKVIAVSYETDILLKKNATLNVKSIGENGYWQSSYDGSGSPQYVTATITIIGPDNKPEELTKQWLTNETS